MSDYICQDLIIKIFTNLPVKSLLRFRVVSKSIRCFIDSPNFIRKHTFLSSQKEKALIIADVFDLKDHYTIHPERLPLCPQSRDIDVVTVKFPYSHIDKIVGSCNGVFCVFDETIHTISLWNPLIRRELTIHDLPSSRCKHSSVMMGFGFDLVTSDYKILRISYSYDKKERCSFVYTNKTGIWCKIDSPVTPFENVASRACCVNGTLHWLLAHPSGEGYDLSVANIMTFDLGTNKFGLIALRKPLYMDTIHKDTFELTTINGSLAIMCKSSCYCEIWIRRDSTATWSNLTLFTDVRMFWGVDTNNGEFLLLTTPGDYYKVGISSSQSQVINWYRALTWFDNKYRVFKLEISSLELLYTGNAYKGTHPSFLQYKYLSQKGHFGFMQ